MHNGHLQSLHVCADAVTADVFVWMVFNGIGLVICYICAEKTVMRGCKFEDNISDGSMRIGL